MALFISHDGNCLVCCSDDQANSYPENEFKRIDCASYVGAKAHKKIEKELTEKDPMADVPWSEQSFILPTGNITTHSNEWRKKNES